jgi:phage recombination protein Bet
MGAMNRPDYGDLEEPLRRSVFQARAKRLERETMTTTAIEKNGEPQAIVVHRDVSGPLEFSTAQRAMIRDTYANGATEKEFQVLLEIAKLRRLNPLLRQIHFVKRWNKQLGRDVWSAQVSVDGLRAIAERTGKYDGQDEPEFGPVADGFPEWCKVKVYRKDWTRPAVGLAYWSEYVQRSRDGAVTRFWADMPRVMIAKCAEAIAMRKAFPEDLGGLYTEEEMQQAENGRPNLSLNPHVGPGQSEDDVPADGGALGEELGRILESIKADVAACDTYDKAMALRGMLGGKGTVSELTKRISAGKESGDISPKQSAELGKLWQHNHRQLAKAEERLRPAIESTFIDEDDEGADGS